VWGSLKHSWDTVLEKNRGGYVAYREIFRCYTILLTELYNWIQTEVTNSLHPYKSNFCNVYINHLNATLNPICHFLALLGVHLIL
jgi:hypothetical protein